MRNLTTDFITQLKSLVQTGAWKLVIEFQQTTTDSIYITDNEESLTVGGDTYDPFPVDISPYMVNNSEGEVLKVTMRVSNVTRELMTAIELGDGLIGNKVRITLVNLNDLTASYTETLEVLSLSLDRSVITLDCGLFLLIDADFPGASYTRDQCRWEFGSTECAVDTANVAIYNPPTDSTCTKNKEGSFGCRFWGNREVAAGDPRFHPERFGAFPSIPLGFEV